MIVAYRDLRDFITAVERLGALRHVAGADPRHEIGGITEGAAGLAGCPGVLFGQDKGRGAPRHVAGADPRHEIGGITEVAAGLPECPALLFDQIKGHAPGVRVFTNATVSPQRAALALGLDPALRPLDALKAWMAKRQTLTMQAPVTIKDGPVLENSDRGDRVDLG